MKERIKDHVQAWGSWTPPVDIRVGPERIRIFVEVPGVDASSLEVRVEGDNLIVEGRKMPPAVKRVLHTEREYGDFFLVIKLSEDVIPSSARASLKAGVLEVEISRINRRIKIQVEEENE